MRKKILFLASLAVITIACSKSDSGEDNQSPAQVVQQEGSFRSEVEAAFKDPNKNIRNIQVGDYVPYKIKITDEGAGENVSYSLFPVKEVDDKHQTKGLDFELYVDDENGRKIRIEEDYVTFSAKGEHVFYIKPVQPGTFILPFKFQKLVNGKVFGNLLPVNINFNAVKITAYTTGGRFRWVWEGYFPPQQFSDNERLYKFKIEDGGNAKDIYLSSPNVTQVYTAKYEGVQTSQAEFKEGEEFIFAERRTQRYSVPAFNTNVIEEIRITQRPANQEEYEIVYYNVNIEKRD